jgi:hypothetical protein
MEDNNGNWNFTIGNITVQDTTPPSAPTLVNSPSGDVSGILVFDWVDGSDPSGISYYILIIDNEIDPFITPGFVYIFNITNNGPESSYCELPEILPQGDYYYFLAQIDGTGQQGSYTRGTFTVISGENGSTGNNDLMFYIIIALILVAAIGSLTVAVIVRKKVQKKIAPPRKRISLKIIIPHITKILNSRSTLEQEKIKSMTFGKEQDQLFYHEELIDEKKLEVRINEIKNLGEELFTEGAYLEAQKQFKLGKEFLLKLGREEEAKLFSELSSGIEGLIEEREKRLELLKQEKIEGNSVKIFELYYDVIEISEKLRDFDTVSMYKSELIQFFQINKSNLIHIERYRFSLEQKADSLSNSKLFEIAAQIYEECEKISHFLLQLGKEEEITNIEQFKNKKIECLKKIS